MDFKEKLSAYVLKIFTEKDIPDIGVSGLEEGLTGENIEILAGLSKDDSPFILHSYLLKTLNELQIELPDEKSAKKRLIDYYSKQIATDKIDPYIGFKEIEKILGAVEIADNEFDLADSYSSYLVIWETETEGLIFYDKNKISKQDFINEIKTELKNKIERRLKNNGL